MSVKALVEAAIMSRHMDSAGVEALKQAALNPADATDIITADEKADIDRLWEKVKSGDVTLDGGNTNARYELENLHATDVFEGDTNMWCGDWFNNDTVMVDLKGVTLVEPWFSGNTSRVFIPFQSIERAKVDEGVTVDTLDIRTSSGSEHSGITMCVQEERNNAITAAASLINKRIEEWNERVNGTAQASQAPAAAAPAMCLDRATFVQESLRAQVDALAGELYNRLQTSGDPAVFQRRLKTFQSRVEAYERSGAADAGEARAVLNDIVAYAKSARVMR